MTFAEAIKSVYTAQIFPGRATRSEFWYWMLYQFVTIGVAQSIIGIWAVGLGPSVGAQTTSALTVLLQMGPLLILALLVNVFMVINMIPGLAVIVRRLHDLDRSGWWLLIGCVPAMGAIILIIWFASEGTPGANRFGPAPVAAAG